MEPNPYEAPREANESQERESRPDGPRNIIGWLIVVLLLLLFMLSMSLDDGR